MKTRAAVLAQMGKPRPYADTRPLVVEEVDLEGPGPREALVEVVAAGLCHSDLSVIDGTRPRPVPIVLGHEAAGIVRAVGPQVTEVRPGDHVVFSFVPSCGRCEYCTVGRPALCEPGNRANAAGVLLTGSTQFRRGPHERLHHHLGVSAFSQFTVAAVESLVRIDPDLPLERAALFGCAVITGVGAVVNTARVPAGSAVAVFGMGGVGLSAVMGAHAAGAHPIIAVDVIPAKLDLARRVGATHVVDARENDPVASIRDLTHGGAPYVFESVGSEQVLVQAYHATRRGGVTVAIGLPHPAKQLSVPAVSIVAEERTIAGSYMGSAVPCRDIPRFIRLHRAGLLPVERLLSRTITLEQLCEAFDALATGAAVRQVVRMTDGPAAAPSTG
jgi:alcohol dehydrogenase